ncbi:MAG: TetR family transcriptional regulator [Gordonia sp. (in: high G+C Gram-positive bacteria)]
MQPRSNSAESPLRTRTSAKQHIQDIALQLFTESGFDSTSVNDVARAASVSPRTVYRYFGTKEQLVVWDPMDDRLATNLQALLAEHSDAEHFLAAVLTGYAALARRTLSPADADRLAIRMRLVREAPELRTGEVQQMDRLAQALVETLASSPIAAGHTRLQLRLAAYQLAWGLLALTDEWAESGFSGKFQDLLDASLPMIIRSVGASLTADG